MKRSLDLLIIIAAAPIVLPLLGLCALIVRVALGSPVFFVQTRAGLRGVPFRMIKFRSMLDTRDASGALLADELRLTRVSRWLRATSLDELPELWNVLRGEMTLVGPRPLLMEYLPRYSAEQARRGEVRPGVTGWAQINGRNATTWDTRLALDVWYVDHQSTQLDLSILWTTIWRVLRRDGVRHGTHETMPLFLGSDRHE